MDAEWRAIQQVAAKQVPCARIKQYWAVCCTRANAQVYQKNVLGYITQILSLEEAGAIASSDEFKDLLTCIG